MRTLGANRAFGQPGLRRGGQRPEIKANAGFIGTASGVIERLGGELAEARQIIAKRDAALSAAVERVALPTFGCDTLDVLADEIVRLRRDPAIVRPR